MFNGNNVDYYADAGQKASGIADTVLQQGITGQLRESQARYEEVTGPYRRSIARHQEVAQTGNDLVALIALERTLDMVETYQRENIPDRKILDADVAELIKLRDELRTKLKP